MPSLLQYQTDWNIYWHAYTGLVEVSTPLSSRGYAYGEATGGYSAATRYQEPEMAVRLDSGVELRVHPVDVRPIERRHLTGLARAYRDEVDREALPYHRRNLNLSEVK